MFHTTHAGVMGPGKQMAHFGRHFLEMCMPMCLGFAVGDVAYFAIASAFGYSEPFRELPLLSVAVVTFNMTAPMVAWMLYRGMERRPSAEMAAAMIALGVVLIAGAWAGVFAKPDLAWVYHGLMMPAMLIPMLLRLDLYTGRTGHAMTTRSRRGSAVHR